MKILIVSQYFWPEDFKVNDIAFDFVKKGHEVTVLTAKPNYPKGKFYEGYTMFSKKEEHVNGVKIIRTPIFPRKGGGALFLALNYLSFVFFSFFTYKFRIKGSFDIVFAHLTSPITAALPAIWIKERFKIPLVIWVLDLWPESIQTTTNIKNKHFYFYLNKLVTHIYAKSDKILVSSNFFISSIKEKLNSESIQIAYFPNWAEDIFTENTKGKYLIPDFPEGFNIVFAGNIGEAQDFEAIVEAAKILRNEKINWIVIGDGRKYNWLRNEIVENKLMNVRLLGRHPMSSMPLFFEKADAMLVSLKNEPIFELTVPAKIQAYMASGKIILGMINGEASNLIEESNCGFVVPAGDYKSLAKKITLIRKMDISDRLTMEENARNYYRDNFSKQVLFEKLEYLFEHL